MPTEREREQPAKISEAMTSGDRVCYSANCMFVIFFSAPLLADLDVDVHTQCGAGGGECTWYCRPWRPTAGGGEVGAQ